MLSEPGGCPTRSPKVFLCGGGTGGHVYPALAVAAALREHDIAETKDERRKTNASDRLSSSIVYIGSEDGMEAGLVAKESKLRFRAIPAAALRGRSPVALARNARTLARGAQAARRLIAMERPLAILGTGGYVCVPLFLAAWAARVPTAIYLPDVIPGLAVRFLARLATVVAGSVEDSARYLRLEVSDWRLPGSQSLISDLQSRLVVTGYPVRHELFDQDRAECRAAFGLAEQLPALFVYGGSRGARSINRAIATLLPGLLPIAQVIHVCGREGDHTWLREAAAQLPAELQARYKLFPYLFSSMIDKTASWQADKVTTKHSSNIAVTLSPPYSDTPTMAQAFGAADIAVCRSGASTLGELPAAGLPAVLVPYPFVHQEENADYLVRRGAAVKVRDAEMLGDAQPTAGPLFQNLLRLIVNTHERAMMSEQSKRLAQPDAAKRIGHLLLALATSKRSTP
jgi:UDP-N-acetylglucosamine--N-acetylmuramyl-(pentapeptide) pyrophosphoryl-undecaprenol N-acetylglucosamine transferase